MANLLNLARMTVASAPGTASPVTLSVVVPGFLTFAQAGAVNARLYRYEIREGDNRELCSGIYTAAGTTLTRVTLSSTNGGSPCNFTVAAIVSSVLAAEDVIQLNSNQSFSQAQQSEILKTIGAAVAPGIPGRDGDDGDTWAHGPPNYPRVQMFEPFAGRLTFVSGLPVMRSSQLAKMITYWTPYKGSRVPQYDGGGWRMVSFGEVSNDAAQSSTGKAGPAAVVTGNVYDFFLWEDDTRVQRLTRGDKWNSPIVRSAATENDLQWIDGIPLNKNAITNGPAALRGTYVGTGLALLQASFDWGLIGDANASTLPILGLWNMYNRVSVMAEQFNSVATWAYGAAAFRPSAGTAYSQISFARGLSEECWRAYYQVMYSNDPVAQLLASIAYDGVAGTPDGVNTWQSFGGGFHTIWAELVWGSNTGTNDVGRHYVVSLEYANAAPPANPSTFYGNTTYKMSFQTLM